MWQKCYLICFITIQDNYLIWLHYRILNQIFGIRNLKFKMGITHYNMCKLCNENEETVIHLFSLYKPIRKFWEDLSRNIKTNRNKELDFSSKDIILGFQENQMWPANILLIIMKKYIFISPKKEKTPQLVEALKMLKSIYIEQEYVSKIQNQECKLKKWDFIPELIM